MTSRELLLLLLRRWYFITVGALMSLAAVGFVWQQPGVYWTQFEVVLLQPTHADRPNKIEDPDFDLAPLAGLLVSDLRQGQPATLMGSSATTLYGEGIEVGWRARLPNTGSQWKPAFSRPVIDVQVVDRDPERIDEQSRVVVNGLSQALQQRQDELGIQASLRVSLLVSPADPVVAYVGGSRVRAAAATGIIGATLTFALVARLDRWLRSRRRPRSRGRARSARAPSFPSD